MITYRVHFIRAFLILLIFTCYENIFSQNRISEFKSQPDATKDQTAALNAILADPSTTGIDFNPSVPTTIKISGTLQAQNKTLFFHHGVFITGGGTINNGVIEATSYRQKIFDTTINLTSCKTASKMWSVMWYGATTTGADDDQPYLQKSSDMMIRNVEMTRQLFLPHGKYKTDRAWILYNWDGTRYGQWNLNIIGEEEIQGANNSSNPILKPSFNDAPAIIVQHASGGYIKGLSIEGTFTTKVSQAKFYEAKFSDLSNALDLQYAPNAGICIDAFKGAGLPPDGGYPTLRSWYRGPNTVSGTTDFHIYQCRVQGFTVDIMNSPNGVTQQGEDCTIEHCNLNNAKVAVAYGNTQSDHTALLDTRAWYYVMTVVDNRSYGNTGVGATIGRIDGMNVAGVVKRIFNINIAQKDLSIKNIYSENVYEIGNVMSVHATVTMETCHFNFAYIPTRPEFHATFSNVDITGSTFKYYDDKYDKRVWFSNCYATRFIKCYFDQPPLIVNGLAHPGPDFVDCLSFDPTMGSNCVIGMHNDVYKLSNTTTVPILYGHFKIQDYFGMHSSDRSNNTNQVAPNSTVTYEYNCTNFNRYIRGIATVNITPDPETRSASFQSAMTAQCKVHDYCLDASTGSVLGRIVSIKENTITISEIPDNISPGSRTVDVVYYLTISRPFIGDITTGSAEITNFVPVLNAPYCRIGDRIEHPAFATGTYIVSYNKENKSVTLSTKATITATKQNFANGDPEVKVVSVISPAKVGNAYTFGFIGGTKWIELPNTLSPGHAQPITWRFDKGGSLTDNNFFGNKAEYNIEYLLRIQSGVLQYYDPYSDSWKNNSNLSKGAP